MKTKFSFLAFLPDHKISVENLRNNTTTCRLKMKNDDVVNRESDFLVFDTSSETKWNNSSMLNILNHLDTLNGTIKIIKSRSFSSRIFFSRNYMKVEYFGRLQVVSFLRLDSFLSNIFLVSVF